MAAVAAPGDRSSYDIFSLVERLGISQSSIVGWGCGCGPLLPLLLVTAATLQWFPRKWITGLAAAIAVAGAWSRDRSDDCIDHVTGAVDRPP